MSTDTGRPLWIAVIDTDTYAGNFERPLAAHITGQIGECQVGEEQAEQAKQELAPEDLAWFENHTAQETDEHGCARPVSIWPTPGWFNHGHGDHFQDDADPAVALASRNAAVDDYIENTLKKVRYENPQSQISAIHQWEARKTEPLARYPAYLSVAIFFNAEPPPHILKLIQDRTSTYPTGSEWDTPKHITGFRLLKRDVVEVPWKT